MEFAKTRVQLRQQKGIPTPRNPFRVVTQVYQVEGLRALYKGCAALVVVSHCLIVIYTLQLPRAVELYHILLYYRVLCRDCFSEIPQPTERSRLTIFALGVSSKGRRPLPILRPDQTCIRRQRNGNAFTWP
jgi:hypothetical protein